MLSRTRSRLAPPQQSPTPARLALACMLCATPVAHAADSLCAPLKAFVLSVPSDESRELSFHTIWGQGFKDDATPGTIHGKRCNHGGYQPARQLCDQLLVHGSAEFAWNNVRDALACLSPETRIANDIAFESASFSFSVGTDERGSLVEMTYRDDATIGGRKFTIRVEGY